MLLARKTRKRCHLLQNIPENLSGLEIDRILRQKRDKSG